MGRVGNLGRADFFVATDLPVDDTLAFRVSFSARTPPAHFKNAYTGPVVPLRAPYTQDSILPTHLGGDNVKTLRGTAVWKPIANFEADLTYTYMKDRSPSVGGQNGSVPSDLLAVAFGHPGFDYRTPGLPYPLGPNDPYTVYRDFPSGDFQDTQFLTLNMRYHAEDFDVVSVTGFIHNSNLSLSDYDNTELNFFQSTFGLHSDQYDEELRVESTTTTPRSNGSEERCSPAAVGTARSSSTHSFPDWMTSSTTPIRTDDAWAAFGQADYTILPGLELTAGLRYTAESKDIHRIPSNLATDPVPPTQFAQKAWSNVSYKLGADYHIDDDKMAYISYSTGFVAGGFNTRVNEPQLTQTPYAPEKATSLEVGLKSTGTTIVCASISRRSRPKYSQLQVGAFLDNAGFEQTIVNNAYERAQGFELEATAIPIDHLTLSTAIGYLDAHYTSFNADVLGLGVHDYSYLKVARAPQWTTHVAAYYDFDLYGNGVLTPNVAWSYEGSHYTDLTNIPVGFQKGYNVIDASLSYEEPNGRWKLSFWGKNLNNVLRRLSRGARVPATYTQLYFDNPRTYGVDLTIKVDGSTF